MSRLGKKGRRRIRRIEANLDMTPMIDIVFQLVIFFLVTTTFKVSAGVNVQLPTSSTQDQVENQDVMILVDNKETIYVNNQLVTIDTIAAALSEHVGLGMDTVIFKIDASVSHGLVVAIMDKARVAGLDNMLFSTDLLADEEEPK